MECNSEKRKENELLTYSRTWMNLRRIMQSGRIETLSKKYIYCMPGAGGHACNPNYSGGRDQEDCGLEPPQANSSQDPIAKNKKKAITKKGWWSDSSPEFKPQYQKQVYTI
jgi:hypothetical protein